MRHCYWKGLRINSVSLFFCFYLLVCIDINAQNHSVTAEQLDRLSSTPFWINLIRYEERLLTFKSAINNDEYFLSKDGPTDPKAELLATIHAFKNVESNTVTDSHPICRFPARYKWLKQELGWTERESVFQSCSNYNKWTRAGQIKSISLYFATGYFGNPASYFGHALIKFNTDNKDESLLDTSVNYGAITTGDENAVVYILKGLFGGFNASFTNQIYYQHNHNYSETELRDLWEYRLNLSQDEVNFIVDHTWELLSHKFSYRFLSDNCAYRIAELLEMIYETHLIPNNPLYTMPITLFDGLGHKERPDGRPLVNGIKRIPSRQSRMDDKYLGLSLNQKTLVKDLINENQNLKQDHFTRLEIEEKFLILETLINYYSYRSITEPLDMSVKKKRQEVILERIKLPPQKNINEPQTEALPPPHNSQNSLMLRLGYSDNAEIGHMTELSIRPALYDLLSPTVARPKNTGLEITNLKIRLRGSSAEINELAFFRVYNLNTPKTDLPGEKKLSWKMSFGLFPQRLNCFNCTVLGAQSGIGTSVEFSDNITSYFLFSGTAQTELADYGTVALNPEIGFLVDMGLNWKLHLNIAKKKFINGQKNEVSSFLFENRFGNSRDWDLRVAYKKIETDEISLSAAAYF